MQIVGVKYEALVNLGDYENEKIGLEARLEGEDLAEAIYNLKTRVFDLLDRRDKLERRREIKREIAQLEDQLRDAREAWEQTADFLRAQGLRADAPSFPDRIRQRAALPPAEHVEPIYAEVVDEHPDHQ